MPFIEELIRHRSVSIVGMSKNAGKTECLNYILGRLAADFNLSLALSSIGIDGEKRDQVSQTDKPEINLLPGWVFITSEKHYLERRLNAEIVAVGDERTATGRPVTARALGEGKALISGPSTTAGLRRMIAEMRNLDIDLTIVDGALSRLSLASPSVTEAMVLATGAAVCPDMAELIRRTAHLYRLINLPAPEDAFPSFRPEDEEQGVYAVSSDGEFCPLGLASALRIPRESVADIQAADTIYASGAVNDNLLDAMRRGCGGKRLIVRDFTRIFADAKAVDLFLAAGGVLQVIYATRLLAVTVNPLAPSGYMMSSEALRHEMSEALGVPVYDVKQMQ